MESPTSCLGKYIGKYLNLQVYDNHLHVYYNTSLVAIHPISSKKLNYLEEHYLQMKHIRTTEEEPRILKTKADGNTSG
jgi:hypothetical protein